MSPSCSSTSLPARVCSPHGGTPPWAGAPAGWGAREVRPGRQRRRRRRCARAAAAAATRRPPPSPPTPPAGAWPPAPATAWSVPPSCPPSPLRTQCSPADGEGGIRKGRMTQRPTNEKKNSWSTWTIKESENYCNCQLIKLLFCS